MKNRLATGRWQWPAPTGYITGSKTGASLIADPVRGPHITKLFTLMATGNHTKASALAAMTALGLRSKKGAPLTQERIRKLLINPLYVGEVIVKGWGAPVRGDFVPLVSQEIFASVQSVLAGSAPAQVAHVRDREEFPLRVLFSALVAKSLPLQA